MSRFQTPTLKQAEHMSALETDGCFSGDHRGVRGVSGGRQGAQEPCRLTWACSSPERSRSGAAWFDTSVEPNWTRRLTQRPQTQTTGYGHTPLQSCCSRPTSKRTTNTRRNTGRSETRPEERGLRERQKGRRDITKWIWVNLRDFFEWNQKKTVQKWKIFEP